MKKSVNNNIDISYEETTSPIEVRLESILPPIHHVEVRTYAETLLDTYRTTRQHHRDAIRSLRRDIRTHRLLIRQARTVYKISKLEEK